MAADQRKTCHQQKENARMASMEKKMGKAKGLTARQKQFLELVLRQPYILANFYLSGGTVLSAWYLHHRESYDLDFFSFRPFDEGNIVRWLKANQETIGYKMLNIDEDFGFLTATFRYHNDTFLKVDFNRYTRSVLKKGFLWRGLTIDSLYDIAVNKLFTIATLPRTRDYVDVYCIYKEKKLSLRTLVNDATKKFNEPVDPLQLAKNFLKVSEYADLPKMLIPFNPKEMEQFFEELATSMKQSIFK
jgi:predicted nucleotidyltransferase component of viral defense system